ncbi:MAG: response regulator transcription factor [Ignavibacterium sp.]
MKKINIVIVEDDNDIRDGLKFLFNDKNHNFICTNTYGSAEELLDEFENIDIDIILMDIGLPGMSGIDCLRKVKTMNPEVLVVMLTIFEDDEKLFSSLMTGADGYILKKTPQSKLLDSLLELYNGGVPMSHQIARRVLDVFRKIPSESEIDSLTKREFEILNLLVQGFTYKQIADKLFISQQTVHEHIKHIYQKLQVHSKTEAVTKMLQYKPFFEKS